MMLPILQTKFYAPPPPAGSLARPQLWARLEEGRQAGRRLALISAPAGYGKTTLVTGWLANSAAAHAWLSLDRDDNDPARFFTYLVHALRRIDPGLAEDLPAVLNLPQPPPLESLLVTLINAAAGWQQPTCLVLDDYHLIESPAVHALVQFLLERVPPTLQLVILTRQDPPLPLARLRARRQLTELRARDLRFNLEEAGRLLHEMMGLDLPPAAVQSLTDRTEGWCAGLQLAGISLQSSENPAAFIENFSGTHRFVIDYLLEEVLAGLDAPLRDFLTRTAVLDRFCAELCAEVFPEGSLPAAETLTRLEQANLFVIPLDEERRWYRYHHLLADLLRSGTDEETRRGVQQQASGWYERSGDLEAAARCALAARDSDHAARLLRQVVPAAARSGQYRSALGWLDALPQPVLLSAPDLAAYRAWFLVFTGRMEEARAWFELLQNVLPPDTPPRIQGMLLGLQAWTRMALGGPLESEPLRRSLEMVGEDDSELRPLFLLAYGQAVLPAGKTAEAEDCFRQSYRLAEAGQAPLHALAARNNLAFLLNTSGRLDEAVAVCEDSLRCYSGKDGQPSPVGSLACIPLGCFLLVRGEWDAAEQRLKQGITAARQLGLYEIFAHPAENARVVLAAERGDLPGALAMLENLARHAEKSGLGAVKAAVQAAEMELRLRAGDLEPAAQWAARAFPGPLPPVTLFNHSLLTLARLRLYQNRDSEALDLFTSLEAAAQRTGWLTDRLAARLGQAAALHKLGRAPEALQALREAVVLAAPQGYRQPFRSAGPLIAALLPRAREAAPEFVDSLTGAPPASPRPAAPSAHPALVEPLGERELEILALAAAGLSNQQIAVRLYITLGTVKWHLNNIYGKLGVKSRTQAAALARELTLID